MAISGGINWVTIQKALYDWVVACTGLAADHVVWGQQQAPRPPQPGIIMRLMMEDDEGIPWLDMVPQPLVGDVTVESVDDVTNTLTKTAHGLLTGDGPFTLNGADVPDGLTAGLNYWIVKVTDDTFKVADGFVNAMNGVTIDLLDVGSGAITFNDNDDTRRAGKEVKYFLRSLVKATLVLECYTDNGVGMDMASSILWRVASKRLLPTPVTILQNANIGVSEVTRVRSLGGTQGNYLFEPRAQMDITLYLASEDSEDGSIFERVEITDENQNHTWTVDVDS
jgi:hypothetical protein